MKITIDSQIILSDCTKEQMEQIIQDNTYQNPEYQQALNMGRKTWGIDKTITTYDCVNNEITVPRGYLHQLPDYDQLTDNTIAASAAIPPLKEITLRDYQQQAVTDAQQYHQGIIQSGTGSGKTIIGLELIHRQQQKTLILTHSKEIMNQWHREIKKRLGIDAGRIGGGKNTQAEITIGMLQTLHKRPDLLAQLSQDYGLVLGDEIHHISAKSFSKTINQLACKYRYGLTATPHRRDGLHQLINRHIGEIISLVPDSVVHLAGGVVPVTIKRINTGCYYEVDSWSDYISELTNDRQRNQQIAEIAQKAVKTTRVLILTDRVKHAKALSEMIPFDHLLLYGQLPAKERNKRIQQITEHSLTIGTTGLLGEGLDISSWTSLILSTPISSKVKLLQAIGRVMRTHEGKKKAYIADLVDDCAFSIASYRKRQKIYQEKHFRLIEG